MGSVCIHLIFTVWSISHKMKEFCSLLCLLLVLPGFLGITQCNFKDKILFDRTFDIEESSTSNDYGAFQYRKLYVWKNHEVNYVFDSKMSYRDIEEVKEVLTPVINDYERKTCIKFREHQSINSAPDHHLVINAKYNYIGNMYNCLMGGSVGGAHGWWKKDMLLKLDLPSGNRCRPSVEQLIYHEMGHAMGIMHTQKRDDRKHYVIFNEHCVNPNEIDQFTEIPHHPWNEQLAYECNSIMHYERNTYNKDDCWLKNCRCNVLSPRPGSNCTDIAPSLVPTKLDWELINIAQKCPGY